VRQVTLPLFLTLPTLALNAQQECICKGAVWFGGLSLRIQPQSRAVTREAILVFTAMTMRAISWVLRSTLCEALARIGLVKQLQTPHTYDLTVPQATSA
jgi:hypothetical protein